MKKLKIKKELLKNNDTKTKRSYYKEIQPALKSQFGLRTYIWVQRLKIVGIWD